MSAAPVGAAAARRFSWRAPVLWAASALLLAAAVGTRNIVFLALAAPLLVAPVLAWADAPAGTPKGTLEWTVDGDGREVRIRGRVVVPPEVRTDGLELRFDPPDPLVPTAAPRLAREPAAVGIDWTLRAERPCVAVMPVPEAGWRDAFGLVEVPIALEGAPLSVERFPPEIARLRATQLRRTTVYPGESRSREHGRGGEFLALRPSGPGDTPRQINWRATARHGRLLANDFLRERTGDLLIVLDLRPTPLGPRRDEELLSIGRAAAYGVASAFLTEKSRVGLATFAEDATIVPLGSGRLQSYRIRQALLEARIGTTAGPVERLAVSLRRRFPAGIGTLVLSSLSDDEGPLMLAHLRRRGLDPFVLAPSPLPLLLPEGPPPDRATALASRLLHLARRQRLAEAWREAPVIEWEEYWSLAPLVAFLSRPLERRPGVA